MRPIIWKAVGGLVFAAYLVAGLPLKAEEPPEDAAPFEPECAGPGSVIWKRQLGTPSEDFAWGVATDEHGNVVIGGYTLGSLGGPNQGSNEHSSLSTAPTASSYGSANSARPRAKVRELWRQTPPATS
ncbi:MAG: SBBP repeat-containing protein [Rhodospirillales bacterium]